MDIKVCIGHSSGFAGVSDINAQLLVCHCSHSACLSVLTLKFHQTFKNSFSGRTMHSLSIYKTTGNKWPCYKVFCQALLLISFMTLVELRDFLFCCSVRFGHREQTVLFIHSLCLHREPTLTELCCSFKVLVSSEERLLKSNRSVMPVVSF